MQKGQKLGEGTFGIVYEAHSPKTKRAYAVKRNIINSKTSFIGVSREIDILNLLRGHPYIIAIQCVSYGNPFNNGSFSPLVGQDRLDCKDDSIHFIFPKADQNLYDFIYHAPNYNYALIKRYMIQMLLGMEYMHSKKIIHRDIKPHNILIKSEERDALGITNVAKICDFGLAKPFTNQGVNTPYVVTRWYRAPEVCLHRPDYGFGVDIWSMGCVLFEMVKRAPFIQPNSEDSGEILSFIIRAMPELIPINFQQEYIINNKYKSIRLKNLGFSTPQSFEKQLEFSAETKAKFERECGGGVGSNSLALFCDLLKNMIKFDWTQRYNISQCINHPFFDDFKVLINKTRSLFPLRAPVETPIVMVNCVERQWMLARAINIFSERTKFPWYTHRSLFQSMDLFDRYLFVAKRDIKVPSNAIETPHKGLYHDHFNTELRFLTCLYLCVKYFTSVQLNLSFEEIMPNNFHSPEAKIIAEQFEAVFIKDILQYQIYRPTIYEAADIFGDILSSSDIADLLLMYAKNYSLNTKLPSAAYGSYIRLRQQKSLKSAEEYNKLLLTPI